MKYSLGILDYGIGGMGLAKMVKSEFPELPILYFSDSGTTPYGKLSEEDLKSRVSKVMDYMLTHGCEQIVVACHSASSILDTNMPNVISIIPSTFEAVCNLPFKSLGILGGKRTIESNLYKEKFESLGWQVKQEIAQPLSVLIESGIVTGPKIKSTVRGILSQVKDVDAILLACTHYPAVLPVIANFLSNNCVIIDPIKFLFEKIVPSLKPFHGKDKYVTTGDIQIMKYASAMAFDFELSNVRNVNI